MATPNGVAQGHHHGQHFLFHIGEGDNQLVEQVGQPYISLAELERARPTVAKNLGMVQQHLLKELD